MNTCGSQNDEGRKIYSAFMSAANLGHRVLAIMAFDIVYISVLMKYRIDLG
jgi:hypothetical protein